MTWKPEYSVGVEVLDRDHKVLFDLVDLFELAIANDQHGEELETLFSSLLDYTNQHFGREEKMLREHGYPEVSDHHLHHADLRLEVEQLHERYLSGERTIELELVAFMQNWLRDHILTEDMKYREFFAPPGRDID